MPLEKEIETYRHQLPELLNREGKYVLIHGEEIIGTFDTLDAALTEGYDRYLDQPFLVRKIAREQPVLLTTRRLRPCPSLPKS